jgi:lipopolysaccharide biosynthesis regulator YciM
MEALHFLLDGHQDEALEKLKKTVKEDTENIMAYIQLGAIFRQKGFPIRAAKIHRDLLVRSSISEAEINTILKHLIIDYRTAGILDKAIEMGERLVHQNKKNIESKELLLSIIEEKEDWDKAFFYRQSINKWLKKKDQNILALYKVQAGLKLTQEKAEHEARIRFKEAIKIDKQCIPAYLYLGDSYRREKRKEDAFQIWQEFTIKNPEWAHLAFNRLKEVLYDMGRYGDIEQIYKQVIRKKTKDTTANLNLIEIYRKQGKFDQAKDLCEQVIDHNPNCIECRLAYAKLLQHNGEDREALKEAFNILNQVLIEQASYNCNNCGFETQEPLWLCPHCHKLNTFMEEK